MMPFTSQSLARTTPRTRVEIQGGTIDAPGGAIVMDYQYTYDGAGNITQRTTQDGEYDYTYDKLDRLTGATPPQSVQASASNPDGLPVEQYSYDQVHNRMSSAHQPGAWSYNAANELLNYGAGADQVSFAYDANGNASKQLSGDPASPSDTREMRYDAAERLRQIDDNGATLATYEYDPIGRRIGKFVAGQTTWYQYADEGLVAQYAQDGTLTRAYGWKPNSAWGSKPLWMAELAGAAWATYTYQTDHLGTPQRTTDNNGSITWAGLSTAFGKTTATLATIPNPLRFPGQYHDAESGLHYNYFRDYEPEIGRYVESDPIGLDGGVNTYLYAIANPLVNVDLLGLHVELRCRRVGNPDNPSLKARIAATFGGEHCFVVVWCNGKDGTHIPNTTISYLGPIFIAKNAIPANNDTTYSSRGKYRKLAVNPSGNDEDCPSCKIEKCILSKAQSLKDSSYRLKNYSIWGPNSNSFARRLVEICGGQVNGLGPPTGWDDPDDVGF